LPRPEPASWLAGGKRILVDRIEWLTMPDTGTATAALQNGEVDWWERPVPDALPIIEKNSDLTVDVSDPRGQIGILSMNHLFPPFNDVRAQRAILMAMSKADYMHIYLGDDDRSIPRRAATSSKAPQARRRRRRACHPCGWRAALRSAKILRRRFAAKLLRPACLGMSLLASKVATGLDGPVGSVAQTTDSRRLTVCRPSSCGCDLFEWQPGQSDLLARQTGAP
jgi:hypothetical protein